MLLNFGKGKNYQWASNHNFHHGGEFAIFQIYGYRQIPDLTLKNSEKNPTKIKKKNSSCEINTSHRRTSFVTFFFF